MKFSVIYIIENEKTSCEISGNETSICRSGHFTFQNVSKSSKCGLLFPQFSVRPP
jgi:hypothetical protein